MNLPNISRSILSPHGDRVTAVELKPHVIPMRIEFFPTLDSANSEQRWRKCSAKKRWTEVHPNHVKPKTHLSYSGIFSTFSSIHSIKLSQ